MLLEIDNILDYILVLARVQGIVLSLILLISQRKQKAALFLGLLLFVFSTLAIGQTKWGVRIEEWDVFGWSIRNFSSNDFYLPFSFVLFLGPSIYFFIKSITNSSFVFKSKYIWHFIPGIMEELLAVVFSLIGIYYGDLYLKEIQTIQSGISYLGFGSTFVYAYISFKLLKGYEDWIRENYSDLNGITLKWLYNLIIAIGIGLFIWLTFMIIRVISGKAWQYSSIVLYGYLSIVIYWLGYSGYNRIRHSVNVSYKPKKKDKEEEIKEDFSIEIKLINDFVTKEKIYLEPTLTIYHLADKVNISPKKLSRVLNEGLQKSFHDFINEYRVEEVKGRLLDSDYQHLTFESIGYDSGFNSKSSFHSIFKKFTGQTPKQFKADFDK